jgi:hypothetical protein
VARYFPDSKRYEWIAKAPTTSDIIQFDDNRLLFSSIIEGLFWLDTNSHAVTRWSDTIPSTPLAIMALFKDHQNNTWAGTQNQGLSLFNPKNQTFTFFTTENGLLSNNIMNIIEDDQDNLWLGTSIGLMRFDPRTKETINIEKQDGLLFSGFYQRSTFKHQDGTIIMGTNNGLVLFDPGKFGAPKTAANVSINDFKLLNQSVSLRAIDKTSVLEKPIKFTDHIILSHQDYVFSFNFSATEYLRPNKIKFAYKMVGLDDKWIYTDASNRVASYTTLPADDYEFVVKASNSDGEWQDAATSVKVSILPPWWLTWRATGTGI